MKLPEDNLKYPVLIKIDEKFSASGFFMRDDHFVYFVTARHVLLTEKKQLVGENAILTAYTTEKGFADTVMFSLNLPVLNIEKQIAYHNIKDVAVVKMGTVSILPGPTPGPYKVEYFNGVTITKTGRAPIVMGHLKTGVKYYSDAFISSDVFIFGYPSSLGVKDLPQFDHDRPLLRKGIVAGKNDTLQTLILDCPVYYGNSGGPVVQAQDVDLGRAEFLIIGVVSQFVPFLEVWHNQQHNYINQSIENSGYSIATPIDAILELIRNSEGAVPPLGRVDKK